MIPPQILWHGTTASFESFDARHLGRMVRNPTTEFGFFFSEDRDDAASWAWRAIEARRAAGAPRLLQIRLDIATAVEVSGAKFQFYLRRARFSTIQRDRKLWQDAGYDGMTTTRGGHRWWCVFDPGQIAILATEPLLRSDPASVSPSP